MQTTYSLERHWRNNSVSADPARAAPATSAQEALQRAHSIELWHAGSMVCRLLKGRAHNTKKQLVLPAASAAAAPGTAAAVLRQQPIYSSLVQHSHGSRATHPMDISTPCVNIQCVLSLLLPPPAPDAASPGSPDS